MNQVTAGDYWRCMLRGIKMADKCPICYRAEGTWTHDPILLLNGAAYNWFDDTHLVADPIITDRFYKGFQQVSEIDVVELQEELKTLEEDNGITPLTVFSPINSTGKFQITGYHIKEMRDSIEKLLIALSLTKTDYFNYDEESQHIIHPLGDKIEWTDPISEATDLQKFQIKYIHIEDLRHFIQTGLIWNASNWKIINFRDADIVTYVKNVTINRDCVKLTVDIEFVYMSDAFVIQKRKKSDLSLVIENSFISSYHRIYSMTVDKKYLWVLYRITDSGTVYYIAQVDKTNLIVLDATYVTLPNLYGGIPAGPNIVNDKDYLYVSDTYCKIYKINKSNGLYTSSIMYIRGPGIGIDDDYLYTINTGGTSPSAVTLYLTKIAKDFSSISDILVYTFPPLDPEGEVYKIYSTVTVTKGRVYIVVGEMVPLPGGGGWYIQGKLFIVSIDGVFLSGPTDAVIAVNSYLGGQGRMVSDYSYKIATTQKVVI